MAKTSKLISEYRKQRRRIQQQIRRMKKRGYKVPESALPKKPKKITEQSVKRLEKITPGKLYQKSKATSETGKIIPGIEKRKQERQDAAQRAAETRRKNAVIKEKETGAGFEDYVIEDYPKEGEIVYNRIKEMINEAGRKNKKAADHLDSILAGEIDRYGFDRVMECMADAPEKMLFLAEVAIRYSQGSNQHDSAIRELTKLITGDIPTAEEMAALQSFIDDDDDFDPSNVLIDD